MDSIPDIIAGCKQGDKKAQEQLYKNFYTAMIKLCLRYTHNEADAVEVMNNGFLKVFRYIHRFDPGKAALSTWIRSVIINSCIDFLKLKENIPFHEPVQEAAYSITVNADVAEQIDVNELLHYIRELPNATRVIFNLYVVEGYTHREIASLLNISDGTSKWHLSEARKLLKQQLNQQEVKYERHKL